MINFKDLNLERKLDKKTFEYNGQEIVVLQYLPVSEKDDIIEATLKKAEVESGLYNPLFLDMYFHLNIIYCYTDIVIGMEDREDEMDLYDILQTNGIIDKVIELMDEDEYNYLFNMLNAYKEDLCNYRTTMASVLRAAIMDLPKNAEKALDILKQLDPNDFKELADIANTLNIDTNSIIPDGWKIK